MTKQTAKATAGESKPTSVIIMQIEQEAMLLSRRASELLVGVCVTIKHGEYNGRSAIVRSAYLHEQSVVVHVDIYRIDRRSDEFVLPQSRTDGRRGYFLREVSICEPTAPDTKMLGFRMGGA